MWRGGQDWNDANCDGSKPYICGYITDGSGSGIDMCSGERPTDAGGDQLLTFGCIDHETVQCTYNANAAGGGDYAASMAAFADCRDASVGVDGYCRGELSAASGLSNQDACGGPNTNIAFHTLIPFTAACEGVYHFRFHADYGYGGFLGVDGVTHSAGDIWGHVFANDVAITAGDHYWESLGFEGCCDGHSEIEIHLPNDEASDPWRPITSGTSADLNGDCGGVTAPPPPPMPDGAFSLAASDFAVQGSCARRWRRALRHPGCGQPARPVLRPGRALGRRCRHHRLRDVLRRRQRCRRHVRQPRCEHPGWPRGRGRRSWKVSHSASMSGPTAVTTAS